MRQALFVALALLWGCDPPVGDTKKNGGPPSKSAEVETVDDVVQTVDDSVPAASATPRGQASADDEGDGDEDSEDDGCAPKDPSLKPLQILRFVFADGVEGKDPKSKLHVAKAGQRVYAHFTMRNRSGRSRCIKLTFRVGGKKRTSVTLKIGKSWQWRTYAYNTLRGDDNKPLELTAIDDQGVVILKRLLAVVPK